MQYITLNNGVRMPQLGFGVYQVPDDEAEQSVDVALQSGYRSIDTATLYQNEEGVGRAVGDSGIDRAELFITTKLWNADQGYDNTLRAFDLSLRNLGMDYIDLYLIHWPTPERDLYVDTWRALERIYSEGRAKAIGVSNFTVAALERVVEETEVVPAVNQIELHPYLSQEGLRATHAEHGVSTEAWAPLGQGKGLLNDPVLADLARKHGRTSAQLVLRWHLQLGNIVIPKSVTPDRIRENIDVFGFELDADDMATISALNRDERVGPDPQTFNK